MMTSSVFDRLVASSLAADSRPILSKNSLSGTRKFIASGANPFIGWYELKEVRVLGCNRYHYLFHK